MRFWLWSNKSRKILVLRNILRYIIFHWVSLDLSIRTLFKFTIKTTNKLHGRECRRREMYLALRINEEIIFAHKYRKAILCNFRSLFLSTLNECENLTLTYSFESSPRLWIFNSAGWRSTIVTTFRNLLPSRYACKESLNSWKLNKRIYCYDCLSQLRFLTLATATFRRRMSRIYPNVAAWTITKRTINTARGISRVDKHRTLRAIVTKYSIYYFIKPYIIFFSLFSKLITGRLLSHLEFCFQN